MTAPPAPLFLQAVKSNPEDVSDRPLPHPSLQAVKSNPEDVSDLLPLLEMVRTEVLYQVRSVGVCGRGGRVCVCGGAG